MVAQFTNPGFILQRFLKLSPIGLTASTTYMQVGAHAIDEELPQCIMSSHRNLPAMRAVALHHLLCREFHPFRTNSAPLRKIVCCRCLPETLCLSPTIRQSRIRDDSVTSNGCSDKNLSGIEQKDTSLIFTTGRQIQILDVVSEL